MELSGSFISYALHLIFYIQTIYIINIGERRQATRLQKFRPIKAMEVSTLND